MPEIRLNLNLKRILGRLLISVLTLSMLTACCEGSECDVTVTPSPGNLYPTVTPAVLRTVSWSACFQAEGEPQFCSSGSIQDTYAHCPPVATDPVSGKTGIIVSTSCAASFSD